MHYIQTNDSAQCSEKRCLAHVALQLTRNEISNKMPSNPGSIALAERPTVEMIDPFGRHVTYLRVSVTDRCDFRCVYCMSEHMTFLPKKDLLTLEELDRLCTAFVEKGVKKLRITGGEPLVRRNIMQLFKDLSRHLVTGALEELTLTTNGSQLAKYADELAGYGVRRVNVSIDTLKPAKFKEITRWGDLKKSWAACRQPKKPDLISN